jgi:hypothetical protein
MSIVTHVLYFELASFITALVTSLLRYSEPGLVARETLRFFITISAGIFIFAALVYGVEEVFIRR